MARKFTVPDKYRYHDVRNGPLCRFHKRRPYRCPVVYKLTITDDNKEIYMTSDRPFHFTHDKKLYINTKQSLHVNSEAETSIHIGDYLTIVAEKDINIYSKTKINLTSDEEININSPIINIGLKEYDTPSKVTIQNTVHHWSVKYYQNNLSIPSDAVPGDRFLIDLSPGSYNEDNGIYIYNGSLIKIPNEPLYTFLDLSCHDICIDAATSIRQTLVTVKTNFLLNGKIKESSTINNNTTWICLFKIKSETTSLDGILCKFIQTDFIDIKTGNTKEDIVLDYTIPHYGSDGI